MVKIKRKPTVPAKTSSNGNTDNDSAEVIVREFGLSAAMLVITPFLSPIVSRDGRALGYFYNLMKKLAENPSGGKIIWVVDKGFNTLETGGTQFANTEQLSAYFKALKRFRGKPGVADWVFAHSVVVLLIPTGRASKPQTVLRLILVYPMRCLSCAPLSGVDRMILEDGFRMLLERCILQVIFSLGMKT